jgi:hypothetical protein
VVERGPRQTIRVHRFLEAFTAAAHDVALEERGFEIYHFFDSDFLGRLIFGHRDQLNLGLVQEAKSSQPSNSRYRLLMGALVGQGLGAPPLMRALLPHLYEVRRSVEGPRLHEPPHSLKMATDDLGQSLDTLQQALGDEAVAPDELLNRFLAQGPQVFYGVELLSGYWQSRLGHVLDLGIREPSPFDEDSEVVGSHVFETMTKLVGDTGRSGGEVSGLRDAMALTTLAGAVSNPSGKTRVRFYTETDRIHAAWRKSPEMRALLTYEHGASEQLDYGEHSALRTVYYYLIRALIPELGYRDCTADDCLRPAAPMAQIAGELKAAAVGLRDGGLLEKDLEHVPVGTSTLGEYIRELTELSPYGTAWRTLKDSIPQGLPRRLVRQLKDVIDGESERAGDLDESFQRSVRELSNRTRDVGEFTGAYTHLLKVMTNWRGALRPRNGKYYCEHVGLTRWGLEPCDADEAALGSLIQSFDVWRSDASPGGDGKPSPAGAGSIIGLTRQLRSMSTAALDGPDRLADHVAVLGFLAFLEDYESVAKYGAQLLGWLSRGRLQDPRWTAYGAVVENVVAIAQIGIAVAQAKHHRPLRDRAAERLLARRSELVARLDEPARTFPASEAARALARGYVTFHAWLAFNPAVIDHRGAELPRLRQPALVKESLDVCSAALESCDQDSPMYALLLNHCVYVASTARQVDRRVVELARKLEVARTLSPQTHSYRIDDTLGFFHLVRAVGRFGDGGDPRDVEAAARSLGKAKSWFDKVPADIEASEVKAHRIVCDWLDEELLAGDYAGSEETASV